MYNLRIFQHCLRTSLRANTYKKLMNHSTIIQKYSTGAQISDDTDLTYVGLKAEDNPEVKQLIKKYYIHYHPICRGLHATYEDIKDIVEHITFDTLKQNMSYGIRTNEGKLVASTLGRIQRDTDDIWDDVARYVKGNRKAELLIETRQAIANKYLLSKKLGVKKVLFLRSILHPDYCSDLLLMNMVNLVEQKGIQRGFTHIKAVCFSTTSKRVADRRGYKLVSQTQYKDFDYLDLNAIGQSIPLSVMVKKLA